MFKLYLLFYLLIHILGDFYFQSEKLAKGKNKSIIKLFNHCIIYLIVSIVVTIPVFSLNLLLSVVILSFIHGIIDFCKFFINKKYKIEKRTIYFIDQGLHILFIVLLSYFMTIKQISIIPQYIVSNFLQVIELNNIHYLSWLVMILLIFKPANITIKETLSIYKPNESKKIGDVIDNDKRTGSLIGSLERFIILILLAFHEYSAIGLVLTAKSVARYNKISEDKNFAEYYLLGTLLSTLIVILIYILVF
ncbi:MAG: DUF3307 domain-containing protein [Clostridiales bacterium]|nr:DUF3307 domain-containing protein [Clostridiales bacterium]